jgi:hypothetical protein
MFKPVACGTFRDDVSGMIGVPFDFTPQLTHHCPDIFEIPVFLAVPHLTSQMPVRYRLVGVREQAFEDEILFGRKRADLSLRRMNFM